MLQGIFSMNEPEISRFLQYRLHECNRKIEEIRAGRSPQEI